MEFTDVRSKQIIFVNHCLLNQNARAPGVAVQPGAFSEIVKILMHNNLSIEQLPCIESMTMGGANRKALADYRPVILHALQYNWFPMLKVFINLWLLVKYRRVCRREARRICRIIDEYLKQGYTVVGIIGVNDSPTCGVTKTLDISDYIRRVTVEQSEENLAPGAVQDSLKNGESFFIGEIKKIISKKNQAINIVGYEPWAKSPVTEARRIARLLKLQKRNTG